ncbi:MAG: enoyl-CoA hydratase/isomerase family protein [Candidatus Binataceae bacterium]
MAGLSNPLIKFENYKDKYQHIKLDRRDGIVQLTIHTKGDTLKFSSLFHTEICDAFTNLGADHDNRAIIITGAGKEFCTSVDVETFGESSPEATARIHWEGRKMLTSLLDIEVPMIGVVNGPATVHAELGVMCDVVLCSDDATFADHPHFPAGLVPGDGVHVVWQHILGPNRGRYFMLMGQVIPAAEALALGIVNEVMARDRLIPRAWEVAHTLLEKPLLAVRYARLVLNQNYRRLMLNDLGYGLAMEMLGTAALVDRRG